MTRVLVVDDEPSYRDYLGRFLARDGHAVRVAASGREAIEVGARFRPDVLVVDWMLRNHVHGLHVVEALGQVRPDLVTIMITGFPSRDLKSAAERARIFRFLEKPFEVEEIERAVREAALAGCADPLRGGLAVVEEGSEGEIRHASPAALDLFRDTLAGPGAAAFADLFAPGAAPDPEAASREWVGAPVRSRRTRVWHVRTHPAREGLSRLWLLRREGERANPPLTGMLLGVEEALPLRWPYDGRVLVVDDDELFRAVARAILESAGAACYAVETDTEALRLLEHDEGLRVALLDYEIPGVEPAALVARLRALRPDLLLVGNSAFDRREEFAKLGVDRFLRKPWRAADLVEALER